MVLKPTEVVPSTVQLLNVPDVGVPRTGVTKAGLVANTSAPVPVSSVTAAAKFADEGVPRNVATPVPNDVIPVPPFATGRVPFTSVVRSTVPAVIALVPFPFTTPVRVIAPVPPFATGRVPETSVVSDTVPAVKAAVPLPFTTPVSVAAPVPPFATGSVPVTPVVSGTKLQLAFVPSVVTNLPAFPVCPGRALENAVVVTNAVVASCVVLVPNVAVGAVGVPVKAGLTVSASVVPVPLVP